MRSPLRSPAQVEGTQGFLPQPGKDLERPSSTRLEARFAYHGSGAVTRSPSPLAWRPDRSEEHTSELQSPKDLVCRLLLEKKKTNVYRRQGCLTVHSSKGQQQSLFVA